MAWRIGQKIQEKRVIIEGIAQETKQELQRLIKR